MEQSRNFVAAEPPSVARRPADSHSVLAKWLDNFGAGIGVLVLVLALRVLLQAVGAAVGLAASPWPSLSSMQFWSLLGAVLGLLAFGALMVLRSALDELVEYSEWRAMQQELDAALDEMAEVQAAHETLRQRYANAQADLADTQRQLHLAMQRGAPRQYTRPEQAVESALQRDAKFLLSLAFRGEPWSRDKVVGMYPDWTPTRWRAARDLLEQARLIRTVGNRSELLTGDPGVAVAQLAAYVHGGEDAGDGV